MAGRRTPTRMWCPKCGHVNPADAIFCDNCGAKLLANEEVQSSMRESVEHDIPANDETEETAKPKFKPRDLYAATAEYLLPEVVDVSQTTKVIVPETVKVLISVDDYNKLKLARKVEDLIVWNFLSQIMLGGFFTLLGIAVENDFSALGTAFHIAFILMGVAATITTVVYWASVFGARIKRKTSNLSDIVPSPKVAEKEGGK